MKPFARHLLFNVFPNACLGFAIAIAFVTFVENYQRQEEDERLIYNMAPYELGITEGPYKYTGEIVTGYTINIDDWQFIKDRFYEEKGDFKRELVIVFNGKERQATFEQFENFLATLPSVSIDLTNYF